MSEGARIAVHAKACTEALGLDHGLATIAEAGFEKVVLWAGETGQWIERVRRCGALGLDVLAVAVPKVLGLAAGAPVVLGEWVARTQAAGAPAISLLFGDTMETPCSAPRVDRLAAWLAALGVPVLIENAGRPGERFSDPAMVARLLARVPGARPVLDLGHLATAGRAPADAFTLASRAAWVEVHDNDAVHDLHLPLGAGEGRGSFQAGLSVLSPLPATIVIETNPRCEGEARAWVSALRADAARLRDFLSSLDEGANG